MSHLIKVDTYVVLFIADYVTFLVLNYTKLSFCLLVGNKNVYQNIYIETQVDFCFI